MGDDVLIPDPQFARRVAEGDAVAKIEVPAVLEFPPLKRPAAAGPRRSAKHPQFGARRRLLATVALVVAAAATWAKARNARAEASCTGSSFGPFPPPKSVSPEAQLYLMTRAPSTVAPPLEDKAAWRRHVAEGDARLLSYLAAKTSTKGFEVAKQNLGTVPIYHVTPEGAAHSEKVVLHIHGGALILGAGEIIKYIAIKEVVRSGLSVYAVDYRMPPNHPFPAGLDDCVNAYRALIKQVRPQDICITGASAGGNLATSMVLKIRDMGLPLPGLVGLFSPEADLTESGDSFQVNRSIDNVVTGDPMSASKLYANGADLADPLISPLFGDFTRGFPPTFIQAGTRDLLLSNAVRLHRALRNHDLDAELHVWEAMPHIGFGGHTPEDREIDVEFRRFLAKHWA